MMRTLFICCLFSVTGVNVAGEMLAQKANLHNLDHGHETLLVSAIEKIRTGQPDEALPILKQLVSVNPKFRLAQLMYADLLLAQSRPIRISVICLLLRIAR